MRNGASENFRERISMSKLKTAIVLSLFLGGAVAANAQTATPTIDQVPPDAGRLLAALPEIKNAVLAATQYESGSVEVSATSLVIVVTLVSSGQTLGSNADRENEARLIASAITRASANRREFKGISALHIDYMTREPDGSHSRMIDKFDFRKDPAGNFQHHIS
jgi:hypothetical protein